MGRPKKIIQDGTASAVLSADNGEWIKRDTLPLVRILSLRPAKIMLADGRSVEPNGIIEVDEKTAEWLLKSFPKHLRKID